jgi:eukaryotic-like serine/threonine-protein kinase
MVLCKRRMVLSYDVGSSSALGRYALYGEIASGGMATVHFGRLQGAVGFARTVALKRLHPPYSRDPEFVAMFLDEARLAARIRHPSVVSTLDVVSDGTELFLVMEYVHGDSLANLLRLARPALAPPRIVARIMIDVLHGLHAAHEATDERGAPLCIVHRDVSPQNVLIGVDGIARIVDFGIAKATGAIQATREGVLKGKVAYMAPERLVHGAVDRRSDIYSAAVVFWEALTGRRLFVGVHEQAIIDRVKASDISPPSTVIPALPPAFDAVALRALAREPGDRYANARDMAAAIDACGAASAFEVGEWVRVIGGQALAQRAACVAEIESGVRPVAAPASGNAPAPTSFRPDDPEGEALTVERRTSTPPIVTAPPPMPSELPTAPKRTTRARIFVGLAALLGLLGIFVSLRVVRAHRVAAATDEQAANAPAAEPPPLDPEPDSDPSAAIDPAAPPSTGGGTRPARGAPGPRHARPRAAPGPARNAPSAEAPAPKAPEAPPRNASCDPPYTVDPRGYHHPKPECL